MASISDIIEQFIKEIMGESHTVNISRNELAQYFECAPSQINYVLATRFSLDKGFVIESKRGGGGFISLVRVNPDREELIRSLLEYTLSEGVSAQRAAAIIDRLADNDIMTDKEGRLIKAAVSDKALAVPNTDKDALRAYIIRAVITELIKEDN